MASKRQDKAAAKRKASTSVGAGMNQLGRSYARLLPSIVAIADVGSSTPEQVARGEAFPKILATGFVVDSARGAVLTNAHVADYTEQVDREQQASGDHRTRIVAFFFLGEEDGSFVILGSEVLAHIRVDAPPFFEETAPFYPVKPPDIAVLFISMYGAQAVEFDSGLGLYAGQDVAFAGFPLGTAMMREDQIGDLVQAGPTLRRGVVAALLPFPGLPKAAHGIAIDGLGQRGFSGAPVFDVKSGDVLGMVWGGPEVPGPELGLRHGLTLAMVPQVMLPLLAAALDKAEEVGFPSPFVSFSEAKAAAPTAAQLLRAE